MKIAIEGEDAIVKGERAVVLLDMHEAKQLYAELHQWFGQDKHVVVEKKPEAPETHPIKPGPVDQKSLDRIMKEYEEEVKRKGLGLEKTGGWIPSRITPLSEPPYYGSDQYPVPFNPIWAPITPNLGRNSTCAINPFSTTFKVD